MSLLALSGAAQTNRIYIDDFEIYPDSTVTVPVVFANESRARGLQYNRDIVIGENAWIGSGVMIVPGVRIGKNAVIGAGSVVTKDIPDRCIAAGNPCKVILKITEEDKRKYPVFQEQV